MWVAGVDGCRAGWVVADSASGVTVVPSFAEILAVGYDVVGVDMPIGLLTVAGARACDVEARRLVGARRSSVFPAPSRAALAWTTWAEAVGISKQTFNILSKVREVDALMTPTLQTRVCEVHPEASFSVLAGAPMAWPKRTPAGRAERMAALSVGGSVPRLPGAAPDDVLDAMAVLWSALRVARGVERRLGDGAIDVRGLRMEIVV
jgi:predicted RNase H-like nuclease